MGYICEGAGIQEPGKPTFITLDFEWIVLTIVVAFAFSLLIPYFPDFAFEQVNTRKHS